MNTIVKLLRKYPPVSLKGLVHRLCGFKVKDSCTFNVSEVIKQESHGFIARCLLTESRRVKKDTDSRHGYTNLIGVSGGVGGGYKPSLIIQMFF